jgi:hypothetical protein
VKNNYGIPQGPTVQFSQNKKIWVTQHITEITLTFKITRAPLEMPVRAVSDRLYMRANINHNYMSLHMQMRNQLVLTIIRI